MELEVKDLVKIYHTTTRLGAPPIETKALDGISFKVPKGEIFGIIGPNGAGKTTTLHILLGLITPTSGSVSIFNLNALNEMDKIRQNISFSSTYLSLPFSLTIKENLIVAAGLYGLKKPDKKIKEVLDLMKISNFTNHLTKELSSGQLSRLLLAKALLNDPKILFLDEPTASLDPLFANKVRDILQDIQKEKNCTIIFSSHNMQEMEALAENVIFIDKGKIVASGNPKELISKHNSKTLEEMFLKVAQPAGDQD